MSLEIRSGTPSDTDEILALYPKAFPDEDLTSLVRALLDCEGVLSLTAWTGDVLSAHALFSPCTVSGSSQKAALLGPLCVTPDAQRQGLGRALIEDGAQRLSDLGFSALLVLGDPAYYSRCGFEARSVIEAPYTLPEPWQDAWRMRPLSDALPTAGVLQVPEPWRDASLWC
jgi:putative acetyltransferase